MKKASAVIISLILMLSLMAGSSVCAYAGELVPVHEGVFVEGENEKLTDKTVYVNKALLADVNEMAGHVFVKDYNEMLLSLREAYVKRSEEISFIIPYDKNECNDSNVSSAIRKCRSEALSSDTRDGDYLFLNGTSTSTHRWYKITVGSKEYAIIDYTMANRSTAAKEAYVDVRVKEIVPTLIGATDYETLKNIHDYICETVTYDYLGQGNSEATEKQLVYSALVKHRVVCGGYATFFYRLAKEAGFKVRVIVCNDINHAWNLVELDGKWYYVDCTWDDLDNATDSDISTVTEQNTEYTYFLKGSADFEKHETPDKYYIGYTNDKISSFSVAESNYSFNGECAEHSFDFVKNEYAPCSEIYCAVYKCKNCGETKREMLNPTEHAESVNEAFPVSCTYSGATEFRYCSVCNKVIDEREEIPAKGHKTVDESVKGGFDKEGKVYKYCSDCEEVIENETLYPVTRTVLSLSNFYYDGKKKKPSVYLSTSDGYALSKDYYTVEYPKDLKTPGKHKIKVKLKGKYSGTKTLTYNIKLNYTYFTKYSYSTDYVKLYWEKEKSISGYQLQYSTNKNFKKNVKKYRIKGAKNTIKKIGSLKSKKKYYFRIRTYKKIGEKTYYSAWSNRLSVKTV